MEEIVVTAPIPRSSAPQTPAISALTGQNLTLALEPSLGQTLSRMPGVSSSYFGPAASRPIIRGLDGDRVRILQNGLNTIDASATSADHAVSFDTSNLKSVEVIRGPASLLYGPNAIGGVVNATDGRIVDEKIDNTIHGALNSRYTSVDNGYQTSLMLEGGHKGLAFHLEAFTGAALRRLEDMDRDRLLAAVGLRHGGHADIGVGREILERCPHHRREAHVVGHTDFQVLTLA